MTNINPGNTMGMFVAQKSDDSVGKLNEINPKILFENALALSAGLAVTDSVRSFMKYYFGNTGESVFANFLYALSVVAFIIVFVHLYNKAYDYAPEKVRHYLDGNIYKE
jgi:hypothetical protein